MELAEYLEIHPVSTFRAKIWNMRKLAPWYFPAFEQLRVNHGSSEHYHVSICRNGLHNSWAIFCCQKRLLVI